MAYFVLRQPWEVIHSILETSKAGISMIQSEVSERQLENVQEDMLAMDRLEKFVPEHLLIHPSVNCWCCMGF